MLKCKIDFFGIRYYNNYVVTFNEARSLIKKLEDEASPIMMDIETRKSETERYYKSISLDDIRNKVNDPDWWYATRALKCICSCSC